MTAGSTLSMLRQGLRRRLLLGLLQVCFLAGGSAFAAAQPPVLDEDNLLLLDFRLGRDVLGEAVTAYTHGQQLYLSLAEAAAALEFVIGVDAAAGRASGWFLQESRSFALDVGTGELVVDGVSMPLGEADAVLFAGELLVSSEAFMRWFPVQLAFDRSSLSVEVSSRESLPVEAREARRRQGQGSPRLAAASLPPLDNSYRLLGPPVADIGLGYSARRHKRTDTVRTGLSYSALLGADMAWMDARLYLSGDKDEALDNARFSLSRDHLGLPLGLRYIELGDIIPALVPGLNTYGNVERGLLLQGGGSVGGRDDLIDTDLINISGDALPGWDVELFQNGMRLDLQTVGSDGRYNFLDIEPLGAENEFELVFHGPAGERRSETLMRYAGLTPDQPGSVRYQLSVSQKNRPLHDSKTHFRPRLSDEASSRIAAGMEVRVLPRLALRGSWTSQMMDGERRQFRSAGLRADLFGVALGLDATRNPWGQTRWDASLQAPAHLRFFGFDARFSHVHYARSAMSEAEFFGEASDEIDDELETGRRIRRHSRTGLVLSRPFGRTATRLAVFHNREELRNSTELSAGFTHALDRGNFGSTLNHHRYGSLRNGERDRERTTGSLFFTTRPYPLSLRLGAHYTLTPKSRVDQYFVDSRLAVAKDLSMSFALSHVPRSGQRRSITRYSAGFSWELPQLTLSPRLNYDSDGSYAGFVYASFSLAPRPDGNGLLVSGRPLSSAGSIAARAFIDHDGSGSFTPGDEPLAGVVIRAPQGHRNASTDADGVALLTALPLRRVTDVVLESDTLPGVNMRSTHAGNAVRPRPGAVPVVDFPVVLTNTIEGRVQERVFGRQQGLAGAVVELRDRDGGLLAVRHSAHDGYYVFEQVPYGDYRVTLGGAHVERLEGGAREVLAGKGEAVNGIDLLVGERSRDLAPAPSIGPRPAPAVSAPPSPAAAPASAAAPAARHSLPAAEAGEAGEAGAAARRMPSPAADLAAAEPAMLQPGRDGRLVQLGAFGEEAGARRLLAELAAAGVLEPSRAGIVSSAQEERRLYRAVLSPGDDSAAARCARLQRAGIACVTLLP